MLYHTMHPDGKAHGGSAILVKSNIKHHLSQSYCKECIQSTSIVVNDRNGYITVSSLHCPPRHTIKEEQFNEYFKTLGNRFIAASDFNAKHTFWGSRLTLLRGRELYNSMQTGSMNVISSGKPTYWPTDKGKIPDIIDFCITKGIAKHNITCNSCWDLFSDHSPILVQIGVDIRETTQRCTLHNKRINWPLFRVLLDEKFDTPIALQTKNDITNAVEFFTTSVQSAAWNSTPLIQHKPVDQYIPLKILDKIGEKWTPRKLWQQNKCPNTKRLLNHKIRELKSLLHPDRNAGFQAYLEGLDATAATSLWKATRKIKRPTVISAPLRNTNNSWARDDQEKADTFAGHLWKVF